MEIAISTTHIARVLYSATKVTYFPGKLKPYTDVGRCHDILYLHLSRKERYSNYSKFPPPHVHRKTSVYGRFGRNSIVAVNPYRRWSSKLHRKEKSSRFRLCVDCIIDGMVAPLDRVQTYSRGRLHAPAWGLQAR